MIYFNQDLTWGHVTAINSYNEPTYSTSTIKGRKEGINKMVNNQLGQTVVSNTRFFTMSAVEVNDTIDGVKVLRVDTVYGFDGLSHYEGYLGSER